ncbi:MAG: DNA recombination protein RmuC, partial [Campylobacteraceae bacterium]|nr:DNA recombination protein RmuC [Campylobacteraceae bacterium]
GILKPFRDNIEGFKKKIEENQKESSEKLLSLAKEIEMVSKTGASISQEASNLAKALKGEKQAQGRWGEMVLESVLEHSGLIKDDHYHMQESYKDDDGKQKRTDVIIKLPEDKSIVIDSKVSLVDYDRYVSSETEEQRKISAIALAKAFKNQIDILSSKEYTQYDLGTLQYVFMFVPIESAYAVAVHQDPSLYEYALKKHIVIVYPSTLIVTLKTIYMYWQRDKADQTIESMYKNAGDLYDKVYAFVETFEKVGRQIDTLSGSYHDAQKHLYEGKGNIMKRANDLKLLGAKTSKNLKSIRLKHIAISDEEIEVVLAQEVNPLELLEEKEEA